MTTLIEAAKLALEAWDTGLDKRPAMEALRTAIEAAEKQEPVAEVKLKTTGGNVGIATVIHEIYSHYREPLRPGDKLYTTPPAAQRHWAGLTDEEQIALLKDSDGKTRHWLVWQVEAKLKEKNNAA